MHVINTYCTISFNGPIIEKHNLPHKFKGLSLTYPEYINNHSHKERMYMNLFEHEKTASLS